jgi:hypothetical protein
MTVVSHTHESAPNARATLGSRLVSAVLSIRTGLRGTPIAERHRSRGSPPVHPRLRNDLGLPEIIEPHRYWEHP